LVEDGTSPDLRKMFVKKHFRGSAQGVFRKLLQMLLDWCKHHDVNEIYLGTTAEFLAAHRFHEKNGFTEIKASELPVSFFDYDRRYQILPLLSY
jgi:GNAT superfamily N-acetyltransferase